MDFLTITELAKALKISRSLAYRMTNEGELPSVKVGSRTLVPRDVLEEWVRKRTRGMRRAAAR